MQSDDSHTKAEHANKPHPLFKVDGQLFQRIRHSITPISLNIDCKAAQQNALSQADSNFSYRHFIQELLLWSPHLKSRPVSRIWINDPFCSMDPPDLTELVYAIAQNFRLRKGRQEHIAVLSCESATREHIALLKGLEFNHIELYLLPQCSVPEVAILRDIIKDFRFPFMSVGFDVLPAPHDATLNRQAEIIRALLPDAVRLPAVRSAPDIAKLLVDSIQEVSYCWHQPSQLIKQPNRLPPCPVDQISIGPGEVSTLGRNSLTNTSNYSEYVRQLQLDHLPVARCSPATPSLDRETVRNPL